MGRVSDAFDRSLHRPVAIKEMLSTRGHGPREVRTRGADHGAASSIPASCRFTTRVAPRTARRSTSCAASTVVPLDALITTVVEERLALIPNVLAACDAVAFAHARGIVHRDIQADEYPRRSVRRDARDRLGHRRAEIGSVDASAPTTATLDSDLTRVGTIAGTPGFMAPEQGARRTRRCGARTCSRSAPRCSTCCRASCRTARRARRSMVDLAGAGHDPDWHELPRDVPAGAAARSLSRRWRCGRRRATRMLASSPPICGRFITGNLVAAYDYGMWTRFVRFVRRYRAAVAVAVVSALIVVVGAVISVRRVVTERDSANVERARAQALADHLLAQHALELANTEPRAGDHGAALARAESGRGSARVGASRVGVRQRNSVRLHREVGRPHPDRPRQQARADLRLARTAAC